MPWVVPREGGYSFPLWREVRAVEVQGHLRIAIAKNLASLLLEQPYHILLSSYV